MATHPSCFRPHVIKLDLSGMLDELCLHWLAALLVVAIQKHSTRSVFSLYRSFFKGRRHNPSAFPCGRCFCTQCCTWMLLGTMRNVASEQLSLLVHLFGFENWGQGLMICRQRKVATKQVQVEFSWLSKPRLTPPSRSGSSSFLLSLNYVTQRLWVVLSTENYPNFNRWSITC